MIITKLSAENFQELSLCESFWSVAFLLPLNTQDKRDGKTGYLGDIITGKQINQDEFISCFERDLFKN